MVCYRFKLSILIIGLRLFTFFLETLFRLEIEAPKDFEFGADDDADEDEQQTNEDTWNDTGLGIFAEENDQQR